jgi:lon-related putative ATP-dependent protease
VAKIKPLPADRLYTRCDPAQFTFTSTVELGDLTEIIGQERALEAIRFGIGIQRRGYNLFALGPAGTGKHRVIRNYLAARAAAEGTPSDWCYVNNFQASHRPNALRLPTGRGCMLAADMDKLVDDLKVAINAAFESEDYRIRRENIDEEFRQARTRTFEEIQKKAREKDIALIPTPAGMALAPVVDGKPIGQDEFLKLPEKEQERIKQEMNEIQEELHTELRQLPKRMRNERGKLRDLDRNVTRTTVEQLIDDLRHSYEDLPEVCAYLDEVLEDIVANGDAFRAPPPDAAAPAEVPPGLALLGGGPDTTRFRRYQVNVVVDNRGREGAPVIYEDHPTYPNLIGRIEHISQFGMLTTDFTLIKGGALHRANGGYLVLDARKLLLQPFVWEELKRALRSGEIRMEEPAQMLGLVSTVTLDPEPVPLGVKIVLLGDRLLYYMLSEYDPDFDELFKVAVDFEDEMERTPETSQLYARLIASMARREGMKPLDPGAVARVIEHGSRISGDSERLTTHVRGMADLLREADYWAGSNGHDLMRADDIEWAIDARRRRSGRIEEKVREMIARGTILIDTEGAKPGQVNGLSVMQIGEIAFGQPSRITARTRLGRGKVVDIDREVELGGPIHSKGVLILSSFLAARYARDQPLSLSASLVFEQSYSGVEGDSASCAELFALLSSLAGVAIRQSHAVTGSVNQFGEVQAIGGVNEKIEGFFEVCKEKGLSGEQGVLIPQSNVRDLMLRHDIVAAAREGRFHIYAIASIDEGMEILTGVPAGERDRNGRYPEGSINRRVEDQLHRYTEAARAFAAKGENKKSL